jgi:Flp pilus assembly protein TadB
LHFIQKLRSLLKQFIKKVFIKSTTANIFEPVKYHLTYQKVFDTLLISQKHIKFLRKRSGQYFTYKQFITYCLVSSLVFIFLALIIFFFTPLNTLLPLKLKILLLIVIAILGFYFVHFICVGTINNRIKKLDQKLPIFIDLMLICLNAGLTIKQTFLIVSEEFEKIDPLIAQEFKKTHFDLTLFLNQKEAFLSLLERMPSKKLEQFISIILTNHEKGGSMSEALSKTSESIAADYLSRIEEKAQKLPGLLSLLLTVFTLPMIFIIIFLPHLKGINGLFK